MKISVIVPAYNAQKSISRLIESLLSQTLKEFEILLIDDGSTDGTAGICDEYVSKHTQLPAIRVFHKKNEGVAMARQLGVDNACGEYSIHADADDWVEPTMLEEMYNKAKAEEADVVIADYFINESLPSSATQGIIKKQKPSSINANQVLIDILESRIFGALWNKMLKTELYKKYNARFFFGINYCEDVLIWAQILKHEEVKVTYLGKAYYHYFINVDSITHKINRKSYSMRRAFKDKLDAILTDNKYNRVKRISSLGIFAEGFMNKCLTKEEIKREFKKMNIQLSMT